MFAIQADAIPVDKANENSALRNALQNCVSSELSYFDFSEDSIHALVTEVISLYNRFQKIKKHVREYGSIDDGEFPEDCKLPNYISFQDLRSKSDPPKNMKRKRPDDGCETRTVQMIMKHERSS